MKKFTPVGVQELRPGLHVKQPQVIDAALPYIKNRKTVIQAGGHLGGWPWKLAQEFKQVVSFEPVPENWIVANNSTPHENVIILMGVLGNKTGVLAVSDITSKHFSGSQTVTEVGPRIPTPVYVIDQLPTFMTQGCGAMFLDVEGFELEILKGAVETLKRDKPVLILEENAQGARHNLNPGDLEKWLKPFGYEKVDTFDRDIILVAK